jgi:adenine-specific DNA-methyltransferase
LNWERNEIEFDRALSANLVMPDLAASESCGAGPYDNLIIEGDNFDALRLLRTTHAHKIRVIYIDPPYNTGEKDWVYNDRYVGKNDRYRHSMWLEFLYQRLTLARDLLAPDGVIMVSINDDNRSRLELMMDEVFSGMRLGTFVWKKRKSSNAANMEYFYSTDHEHVLVYARGGFEFLGSAKDWAKYNNWDEEFQDWWTSTQLTLGFNRDQRKNLFYPLRDPKTDIWYPCDPKRVWARATEVRLNGKEVRTETMEVLIARNGVHFPDEKAPAFYKNLNEIKQAIDAGTAPPHLDTQDDLSFWVSKYIGYGKPRFKTYKKQVRSECQPLSSWIAEPNKAENEEEAASYGIESGMTSEGTKVLRTYALGEKFPYPKPLSLLKNLIRQSAKPGDIVLDFFAGSGTTAQAVLEINAEVENNPIRFILVSSTEATANQPTKNVARDACAERVRRVIHGYKDIPGVVGNFAYLRLRKLDHADAFYDLAPQAAWHALCLKHLGRILPYMSSSVGLIATSSDTAILFCATVNDEALAQLAAHPAYKLRVYSDRPDSVASYLLGSGKLVDSLSWSSEAIKGQQA